MNELTELTEEWILKHTDFKAKTPYGWNGNGYDYTTSVCNGGSHTEYHDYVLRLSNSDDDFIIRFSKWEYSGQQEPEVSISFHLCGWHEKCNDPVKCFDTNKVLMLQRAFYISTGELLKIK